MSQIDLLRPWLRASIAASAALEFSGASFELSRRQIIGKG